MIAPTPNYTDYIKPKSPGQNYEPDDVTIAPKAPKKEESDMTDISQKKSDISEMLAQSSEFLPSNDDFSDTYITFNTYSLIKKLDKELEEWERSGTDNALPNISNIKDILRDNEEYLVAKPENRILFSLLELLFENNNWEVTDAKDIAYLRNELRRFQEGEVSMESLRGFSKQLYRKRFSLLKSSPNEKKKTKQ